MAGRFLFLQKLRKRRPPLSLLTHSSLSSRNPIIRSPSPIIFSCQLDLITSQISDLPPKTLEPPPTHLTLPSLFPPTKTSSVGMPFGGGNRWWRGITLAWNRRSEIAAKDWSAYFDNALTQKPAFGFLNELEHIRIRGYCTIHTSQQLSNTGHMIEPQNSTENALPVEATVNAKVKRKKLKGKRAVVRWLKHFRWQKKKEYERMTAEEKILYKLRKARRKEERIVEALKKIEPSDSSEATHDPEILTPEEHFYLLKMGHKCKNYVPVGRRGIFQGVILNMHLHWKKHQTLKVIVKTFTPEEVREIAAELARLSGGIVLEIHEENTIIMYRGKNYSQPPTEIMSPKVTLTRKKALDKSKHRDTLRAVRRYIPKLQQDLQDLQTQMKERRENKDKVVTEVENLDADIIKQESHSLLDNFDGFEGEEIGSNEFDEDDSLEDSETMSESEDLSDIFETESDVETEEKDEKPLYLDTVEKFPSEDDGGQDDFEEHLRKISAASKNGDSSGKDVKLPDLDEIDKMFLRASSLLKKKRR